MKPFTSLVLTVVLGTTATLALSQSANAGSRDDYYQGDVYREHRSRYPEHKRGGYYREGREYRRENIRYRNDRSDYDRGDYRDNRSRNYRGDRDRYHLYERDRHNWNYYH